MMEDAVETDEYHRGYKVGWDAANGRQDIPSLAIGTQIIGPTFIVDVRGECWWIDPHARRCERLKDKPAEVQLERVSP